MARTALKGAYDDIVCSISDYTRLKLPTNYIPIRVRNKQYLALVDTGARFSVLDETLFRQWMGDLPLIKQTSVILSDAQGKGLHVLGQVTVPVQIQEETVSVPMVVVRGLAISVILGLDFMHAHHVTLQFGEEDLTMHGVSVVCPVIDLQERYQQFYMMPTTTELIPPGRLLTIPCRLSGIEEDRDPYETIRAVNNSILDIDSDERLAQIVYISPLSPGLVDKRVVIPHALSVLMVDNTLWVRLANVSCEPMVVFSDTILGQVRPGAHMQVEGLNVENPDPYQLDLFAHLAVITEVDKEVQTEIIIPADHANSEAYHKHVLRRMNKQEKTYVPLDWETLLDVPHLTEEQKQALIALLDKYRPCFAATTAELGKLSCIKHTIEIKENASIVRKRPYKIHPSKQEFLDREVARLLEMGAIEPSSSMWRSPVLLVKKKQNKPGDPPLFRMVCDYRHLNERTVEKFYPMPLLSTLVERMTTFKPSWFSCMDAKDGYLQIKIDKASRDYTTFDTGKSTYRWKRMAFGLAYAPASFSKAIQMCLNPLPYDVCFHFLDDILVMARSFDEMLVNLGRVFERLMSYGFTLHIHKHEFAKRSISYLGFVIGEEGVSPQMSRVATFDKIPTPRNARDVKALVGALSYYRSFISYFARRAKPLYDLIKEDAPFEWTPEHEEAKQSLIKAILATAVLYFPDLSLPFYVQTDACCLLYTSPSPRDRQKSRMPSSA